MHSTAGILSLVEVLQPRELERQRHFQRRLLLRMYLRQNTMLWHKIIGHNSRCIPCLDDRIFRADFSGSNALYSIHLHYSQARTVPTYVRYLRYLLLLLAPLSALHRRCFSVRDMFALLPCQIMVATTPAFVHSIPGAANNGQE